MVLNKYLYVFKINLMNSLAYLGDLFMHTFTSGLYVFIFVYLWSAIYESNQLFSLSLVALLWYLGMAQSIYKFGSGTVKDISDLIQRGDIVNSLNKPYNFILYHFFESLGKKFLLFFTSLFWVSLVLGSFFGWPDFELKYFPIVFLVIVLGVALNFLISFIISTVAFWVEDARPYAWMYSKLIFIMGGLLFPLELLPGLLREIALLLPTSYFIYFPARLFVDFSWNLFWNIIIYQIISGIILIIIATYLYRIGVRKVSTNGG